MPSAAEAIHDLAVHHRIALSRYSNTVVRDIIGTLNKIEADTVARLTAEDLTEFSRQRLEDLLGEIRRIQAAGWVVLKARMVSRVQDLAQNETDFAQQLVAFAAKSVEVRLANGAPNLNQVWAAVQARPFEGRLLKDWLTGAEESVARKVQESIRQGFIEGQTTDQIVRALRGTKAARYQNGVLEGTRRGVAAMVKTALTHTSNVAHEETFKQNADVVTGVIWTSTLDRRTTLICISRSEKVYPVGSGPRPPAHINCRSTTRPQVRKIEGVAPFEAPTYQEWLSKQPASVQDDVLGRTRAQLFRNGGLKLDRFVDDAGRTITLDELRARDASAFDKAGL